MDVHPIVVHFPIALLTLYACMECLRFERLQSLVAWFYIKLFLVLVGVGGSWFAFATGNYIAEKLGKTPLIETHAFFAVITVVIFTAIGAMYIIEWAERDQLLHIRSGSFSQKVWFALLHVFHIYNISTIRVVCALAGLVALTITGGLGGAIVYGSDIDPMVKIIHSLFF